MQYIYNHPFFEQLLWMNKELFYYMSLGWHHRKFWPSVGDDREDDYVEKSYALKVKKKKMKKLFIKESHGYSALSKFMKDI